MSRDSEITPLESFPEERATRSIGNEEIANRILLALPTAVLKQLLPYLKPMTLQRGQEVCRQRQPVREVLFINRGMVSLVKSMRDGRTVEIGAKGIEGITAPETLFGINTALFECVVQIPGIAFAIDSVILQTLKDKNHALNEFLQEYIHIVADEIAQSAACNRLHSLEQRCCRWLLIAHDSVRADTFPLTHELLAMMLGAPRPGVSIATANLQRVGLIRYTRGHVAVTDRMRLEASACECYDVIRREFDDLFTRWRQSA